MKVMTVLGEIAPEEMGVTQLHEHILANADYSHNDFNFVMDEVDVALEEIKYFRQAGGQTMFDLSCTGLGQDVRGLKTIAEATGVHIVTATGFYRECSYPDYVRRETADQLAQRMINDYRHGIDGTEIKPGILAEIATEYGVGSMSPEEEKVFTAVAYAQRETGLPVSTHCWAGELAFEQIAVLTRNGVPPNKIVIGHLGVDPEVKDRIFKIAETGVFLGIDCIGYAYEAWVKMKDPAKALFVRELIQAGFLHRITISQDLIRKLYLKHYHGIGYDYLLRHFVPMLETAGVTPAEIDTLLRGNPQALFA